MTFIRTDSGSHFLFGMNGKAVGDKVSEGGKTLTSISFCLEAKRLLKQLSKQSHLLLLVGDGKQRKLHIKAPHSLSQQVEGELCEFKGLCTCLQVASRTKMLYVSAVGNR